MKSEWNFVKVVFFFYRKIYVTKNPMRRVERREKKNRP